MAKLESFKRLILIIRRLKSRPATWEEIEDFLKRESELQSYNFNISKRSFQRDIREIKSLFDFEIYYDFSTKVYRMEEPENNTLNNRLFEALDTYQAFNVSQELSRHVYVENRRPQGTENIFGLLHALNNYYQVEFLYHKFQDERPNKKIADPLALKEFKNRWYLIARDQKDGKTKTFALDRLNSLEITRRKFIPDNFQTADYFKHCFGVICPTDQDPEEIVLSFQPIQGKYIKTLPLHTSQEIIVEDENEFKIKLLMFPTHDFIMELLSMGANVRVEHPKWLADKIREEHIKAMALYDSNDGNR